MSGEERVDLDLPPQQYVSTHHVLRLMGQSGRRRVMERRTLHRGERGDAGHPPGRGPSIVLRVVRFWVLAFVGNLIGAVAIE